MNWKDFSRVEPVVFAVDEDPTVRLAIQQLSAIMNFRFEGFSSGTAFLDALDGDPCGCVVTELKVPELNGIQIQQTLTAQGVGLPLIFLTAHATVPFAVRALREGAFHLLEKPVPQQELWDTIQQAIERDIQRRDAAEHAEEIRRQLAELTMKEEQVLHLMGQAKGPRTIAKELDLSIRTIEVRRNRIMKKLGLKSPDELLRFALDLRDERPSGNGRPYWKSAVAVR